MSFAGERCVDMSNQSSGQLHLPPTRSRSRIFRHSPEKSRNPHCHMQAKTTSAGVL